jgi:hypothetical protein
LPPFPSLCADGSWIKGDRAFHNLWESSQSAGIQPLTESKVPGIMISHLAKVSLIRMQPILFSPGSEDPTANKTVEWIAAGERVRQFRSRLHPMKPDEAPYPVARNPWRFKSDPGSRQSFDRKLGKTNRFVATKALACKWNKAAWHIMSQGGNFDPKKVFPSRAVENPPPRRRKAEPKDIPDEDEEHP